MPGTAQQLLERTTAEPPWYFYALEDRVERLELMPHSTDIAVLAAKVDRLSEDVRTLRNAVYLACGSLGTVIAYFQVLN